MRRIGIGVALLTLSGFVACGLLLPEGMAIKGPILNSILGRGIDAPTDDVVERRFRAAPGFEVELFAEGIPNARFMRFSPGGNLVVSQPRLGQLLLVLHDRNGDGRSDGKRVLIGDLERPHGLDFWNGRLYIAEGSAITRVDVAESGPDSLVVTSAPERIVEGIPSGGNHWFRTLRFGPDGRIYLSVGSSCNVCREEDPRRAAILRYRPDGSEEEIFATGLRNSVGFDWRPGTNELFATDNGRDLLGDDVPPCEFNRIVEGGFYGWPVANGHRVPDPDFGEGEAARIASSIPPAHAFRAHNAPLGMTFVRHPDAPESIRGAALVALHGSWNRSELDGYKVVSLHWDGQGGIRERDFLTGFLVGDDVVGRPVDVVEGPDGAFYISDDYAGAIFRVARKGLFAPAAARPLFEPRSEGKPTTADPLAGFDASLREALAERGAALFARHACGTCHVASQAEPGIVTKPLVGLASKYSVASLASFFLTPQPPMPVFDLSDTDRQALAVHLLEAEGKRLSGGGG